MFANACVHSERVRARASAGPAHTAVLLAGSLGHPHVCLIGAGCINPRTPRLPRLAHCVVPHSLQACSVRSCTPGVLRQLPWCTAPECMPVLTARTGSAACSDCCVPCRHPTRRRPLWPWGKRLAGGNRAPSTPWTTMRQTAGTGTRAGTRRPGRRAAAGWRQRERRWRHDGRRQQEGALERPRRAICNTDSVLRAIGARRRALVRPVGTLLARVNQRGVSTARLASPLLPRICASLRALPRALGAPSRPLRRPCSSRRLPAAPADCTQRFVRSHPCTPSAAASPREPQAMLQRTWALPAPPLAPRASPTQRRPVAAAAAAPGGPGEREGPPPLSRLPPPSAQSRAPCLPPNPILDASPQTMCRAWPVAA